MYGILLGTMVLIAFFLCVVILLQAGKGGGLAAMGGGAAATDGVLAGRQAQTVLTRATWIGGFAFMALALVLSIMSSRSQGPESILRPAVQAPAPEPIIPGVLGGDVSTPPAGGEANSEDIPPSDGN
jgi:preprotein translocase subunit SecG